MFICIRIEEIKRGCDQGVQNPEGIEEKMMPPEYSREKLKRVDEEGRWQLGWNWFGEVFTRVLFSGGTINYTNIWEDSLGHR